ncbi:type IV pilin [Haloarchaeobius sp. TZWWS8]|uniref:type IV pilin n=1 Tax=Haloarchaeobius sp. TZWWS8 TaxID=3446121 RepID=UPI003EBDC7F4
MRLRALLTDDDALSPVIGVVLMVAVTIVLSAAVGAFVLDIGTEVTQKSPSMVVEYNMSVDGAGTDSVELAHAGGDTVDAERLLVTVGGTTVYDSGSDETGGTNMALTTNEWTGDVTSGKTLVIEETGGNPITPGKRVLVVWNKGSKSFVLSQRTLD